MNEENRKSPSGKHIVVTVTGKTHQRMLKSMGVILRRNTRVSKNLHQDTC